jgi:ApbE superfamily uncharacterized protein (UPF0280 family)
MKYEERAYRLLINNNNLISYNVAVSESDLFISSDSDLSEIAGKTLLKYRAYVESYISQNPQFKTSLLPLPPDDFAPAIIRDMLSNSLCCGVGPMASVAGAIAQFVGYDLLKYSENLIIENGGDIFLKSMGKMIVSIFAGTSPLSYKTKFIVNPIKKPLGICTSSATVGPSLNFGKADAICVISNSATLSDAAATAIGNKVKNSKDLKKALDFGMKIENVQGIIIIYGETIGAIGEVEFI